MDNASCVCEYMPTLSNDSCVLFVGVGVCVHVDGRAAGGRAGAGVCTFYLYMGFIIIRNNT